MSHTIDDRIMELADEYTLNHSDEDYLSNMAMLNEFKQVMIEKACELYCSAMCGSSDNEKPSCNTPCGGLEHFRKAMEL